MASAARPVACGLGRIIRAAGCGTINTASTWAPRTAPVVDLAGERARENNLKRSCSSSSTESPAGSAARTSSGSQDDVLRMDAVTLSRQTRQSLAEGQLSPERWQQYASRASQLMDELSLTETSRLAAAFSTARHVHFDLFARFSTRALTCLRSINDHENQATAKDLRRLAMSFGRGRVFDSELMEAMVPLISDNVEQFRPRDLVHIVDAYARLPMQSPELFALVADALPDYLYDLKPLELAILCRAFAEAAVYSDELIDALCAEVVKRLRTFGALECLIFLEGLSRLCQGLPDDMQRDDMNVIKSVVHQLSGSLGSLAVTDIIRVFASLVRLHYYDSNFVHRRICVTLSQKRDQLDGSNMFPLLAELLHCLSLLPAQSHKSVELSLSVIEVLRSQSGTLRGSRVDPRSVALAVTALAQLEQKDEDLLTALAGLLLASSKPGTSLSGPTTDLMDLATDEELLELRRAFGTFAVPSVDFTTSSEAWVGPATAAVAAISHELNRREAAGVAMPANAE
eukprot:TRINITY_DN67116_c0_g1_i1.p1 TRINITY_DN67116_c0_g1~~TRINITY_DN67116_c0_g1_i1.p1  ORF type:complete len:530 (+),score=85.42 TRINITY_DN67116_c0_g1_i1:46-1590(+)